MIPLDKSHTCLFLSDTFREKSLIRSRLMDLFLFSDKTVARLLPNSHYRRSSCTEHWFGEHNSTVGWWEQTSYLPFSSLWHFFTSRWIMSHMYLVLEWKDAYHYYIWKFIYTFSDILSLDLQSSDLHRFVSSTQNKDLQCLVISAIYSLGKSLFI